MARSPVGDGAWSTGRTNPPAPPEFPVLAAEGAVPGLPGGDREPARVAPLGGSLVLSLDDLRSAAIVQSTDGVRDASSGAAPVVDLRLQDSPPSRLPHPSEQHRIAALLRLAQRGDGEAFGRIYDRYVDQVYRYLYYRVGSHALAEDLTSETFLRALRRIDSFSWQGRDIGAWFITIARNLVTDHIKSSRSRLEISSGHMLDVDQSDEGIEQKVLDRLQGAALLAALRQLKAEQQECLILRFLQGLSVAETAEIMDRSEGAIKQLQLRGVRTLAKLLSDHKTASGRP